MAGPGHVGVCFGGPSPEHDVSILTGLQAARELSRAGHRVSGLYWTKAGEWFRVSPDAEGADFADGVPRSAEALRLVTGSDGGFVAEGRMGRSRPLGVDVVVNCCHGGPGEDGTLQACFDLAGVTYTGPGVGCAALGMDKLAFGGVVEAAGLPVLRRRVVGGPGGAPGGGPGAGADDDGPGFDGPYIVKPRFGGSSIGIDVVADLATARARLAANPHLRRGAVLEPYRADLFDLNIGVRLWPEPTVSAIERPERTTAGAEILNYADKYVRGEGMAGAPREIPAVVDPTVAAGIRSAALAVAALCDVRGAARVDFLSDGTSRFVNEINTIPGSLGRYLWVEPPLAFSALLTWMIDEARARPSARPSAVGADGTLLRSAGSIAAKLG